MAVHKVFLGGLPQPYTYGREMFPSRDFPAYTYAGVDHRKFTASFSNSRKIDFSCSQECISCGEAYAEAEQLKNYFEQNPIAVGDIIEIIGISMYSTVDGIWWNVEGSLPGLEFQMQVRGLAGSSIPAPVNVGAPVNAGIVASGYVEFSPKLYADHNDMLQLVVTAVPAPSAPNCNSCTTSMLSGLKVWFAVDGKEMCRGDIRS